MKRVMLAMAALALCGCAMAGDLQGQVRWGAQVLWGDDTDIGIGARLEYRAKSLFGNTPITSAAHLDWYFPGNSVTYLELNYNLYYDFTAKSVAPYAGGGLRLGYASSSGNSDTDIGLNLGGGMKFKSSGKVTPFVEGRFTLGGDVEQLVLAGGILF